MVLIELERMGLTYRTNGSRGGGEERMADG